MILYIWTGTNVFNINVIDKLRIKFKIGKENTVPFYFLCLDNYQQQLNSYYAVTK